MASEYRVMNLDGVFVVQKRDGGEWEEVNRAYDINAAKEMVRSYRRLSE